MDYKILKEMLKEARQELLEGLDDEEAEELLDTVLSEISEDEKLADNVYLGDCIYYVIRNGEIYEITDDAGDLPRGGWFPEIIRGLKPDVKECIDKIREEVEEAADIDELYNLIKENLNEDCLDDDEILEMLKDMEELDCLKLFRKLKRAVKKTADMFSDVTEFFQAYQKYDLDPNTLYYWWEDDYIDLYDNIQSFGEPRGSFEEFSAQEWLEELCDLENTIVEADS